MVNGTILTKGVKNEPYIHWNNDSGFRSSKHCSVAYSTHQIHIFWIIMFERRKEILEGLLILSKGGKMIYEGILAVAITACSICPHNRNGFCYFYCVLIINVPAGGRYCIEFAKLPL